MSAAKFLEQPHLGRPHAVRDDNDVALSRSIGPGAHPRGTIRRVCTPKHAGLEHDGRERPTP